MALFCSRHFSKTYFYCCLFKRSWLMIIGFSLSAVTYENLMRSVRFKNCFLECSGNLVNIVWDAEPDRAPVVTFHPFPCFGGGRDKGRQGAFLCVVRRQRQQKEQEDRAQPSLAWPGGCWVCHLKHCKWRYGAGGICWGHLWGEVVKGKMKAFKSHFMLKWKLL